MPRLGAHVSTAGGVSRAFGRGHSIGCETMQIFTRNNNRWDAKPLDQAEITAWRSLAAETGIAPVVAHASYLVNLASPDPELWQRSILTFIDELERAEALGLLGVVIHPGSHMGAGEAWGLQRIATALDACMTATPGYRTLALLETTAGTGQHLGHRFEHLAAVRELSGSPGRLAVCFDTCHVLAAGYELRTEEGYQTTLSELERTVGLEHVRCLHLNDSKHDLGSHKDRHTHIGEGFIGQDGFRRLLNDPRLADLPMVLETPKSDDLHEDVENLARLRALVDRGL